MREIQTEDVPRLREHYRHFTEVEAAEISPLYAEWAQGVAADEEIIELLMELPPEKRQANLVFAAARVHGAPLVAWPSVKEHISRHWTVIAETIGKRRTQTNEAGRIAVLNYAFSRIAEETGQPLALIEVGAAAGLGLYPDSWPIHYTRTDSDGHRLSPRGSMVSSAELRCEVSGIEPPERLPEIAWRAGIDLNPLDLTDHADRQWLQMLIWPGMEYRLERIEAGAELIQADPPYLVSGDLLEELPGVLEQVPEGSVPVVFHSAVLVYLSAGDRARFLDQVRDSGARWVSNEGLGIFPEIAAKLPGEDPERSGFILALDGEPLARTGPHGQYLHGLGL